MHATFALSCFKEIIHTPIDEIQNIGDSIPIPNFTEQFLLELIHETKNVLKKGTPIVYTSGDIVVVGDIHGNLHDLFRIFAKNGLPPEKRYLFLGDYVDRGDYSLQVITFLFALKVLYPENLILLRGNHEFKSVNQIYGFWSSINDCYKSSIVYDAFNDAFDYLPLCCFIDKEIFCVHGGISHRVTPSSLFQMQFPIAETKMVIDLTWSDPSEDTVNSKANIRGKGIAFGIKCVKEFFELFKVNLIIRAHQCVNGYHSQLEDRVLTVFSSSNYGNLNNDGGYVYINRALELEKVKYPPIQEIRSNDASFIPVIYGDETKSPPILRIMSKLIIPNPTGRRPSVGSAVGRPKGVHISMSRSSRPASNPAIKFVPIIACPKTSSLQKIPSFVPPRI